MDKNNSIRSRPDIVERIAPQDRHLIDELTLGSSKRVHFVCPKNHVYQSFVYNVARGRINCPICLHKKIIPNVNDLATEMPEVAAQLDKSNAHWAHKLSIGSHRKLLFVCDEGHKYSMRVADKCRRNSQCPHCAKQSISFIEEEFFQSFKALYPDTIHGERINVKWKGEGKTYQRRCDVDIFILSKKLVIEYDGKYWHDRKMEVDRRKTKALLDSGYSVIRIRDKGLKPLKVNNSPKGTYHEYICTSNIHYSEKDKIDLIANEISSLIT